MKEYLNFEDMEQTLLNLYKECISDDDAAKYESIIEEYAYNCAESLCDNMREYVHQKDTRIEGNLCNIREDWEETYKFIDSEVKPWGKFDDVIKSIDNETISEEDFKKFQTWCKDWFFRAFGTFGLCYNFQSLISEMEWEEEHKVAC